jgi:hypothetical protein
LPAVGRSFSGKRFASAVLCFKAEDWHKVLTLPGGGLYRGDIAELARNVPKTDWLTVRGRV